MQTERDILQGKPFFRFTKEVDSHITDWYKSYSDDHSNFENAFKTTRFPAFEVFRSDVGLSIRVRDKFLLTSIRSELENQGWGSYSWHGRVIAGYSYWDNENLTYGTNVQSSFTHAQTDIGLKEIWPTFGHDSEDTIWRTPEQTQSTDFSSQKHGFLRNESASAKPSTNDKRDGIKCVSLPESLDFSFEEILRIRTFMIYQWECMKSDMASESQPPFSTFENVSRMYPPGFEELKLFVVDFLKDESIFDECNLPCEPSTISYQSILTESSDSIWHNDQERICEVRLAQLVHLFDESTDALDVSDAYMGLLFAPLEDEQLDAWLDMYPTSATDFETLISTINAPLSYVEEMSEWGKSFPRDDRPILTPLPSFKEEVQRHQKLLFANPELLSRPEKKVNCKLRHSFLSRNVRSSLKTTCQRLADLSQQDLRLQSLLSDHSRVWEVGCHAIDAMLHNYAPQTFEDIMGLILVAASLRPIGIGVRPGETTKPFCSIDEFVHGLNRWRPHVQKSNVNDLDLFDKCVHTLWPGQSFPLENPDYQKEDLQEFRELLNGIIIAPLGLPSTAQTQQRNRHVYDSAEAAESVPKIPPTHDSFWKDLSGPVVLLTATAVFGTILAFFLSLENRCCPSQQVEMSTFTRNSWLIAKLLGLSRFTIGGSSPFTEIIGSDQTSHLSSSPSEGNEPYLQIPITHSRVCQSNDGVPQSASSSFNPSSTPQASSQPSSPPLSLTPQSSRPSSTKKASTRCPHCQKVFSSVGNKKKHVNSACKSAPEFPNRLMIQCAFGCGYAAAVRYNVRTVHGKTCSRRNRIQDARA